MAWEPQAFAGPKPYASWGFLDTQTQCMCLLISVSSLNLAAFVSADYRHFQFSQSSGYTHMVPAHGAFPCHGPMALVFRGSARRLKIQGSPGLRGGNLLEAWQGAVSPGGIYSSALTYRLPPVPASYRFSRRSLGNRSAGAVAAGAAIAVPGERSRYRRHLSCSL
ncbi:unnamed protein product [Caretta caretta]